jgi:protein gp37
MGDTKIEWTEKVWNPIRGCARVSPGCGGPGPHGGCYAEAMAARFSNEGMWGHGFAERTSAGGRWTGNVAVQWDRIDLPLKWRKPSLIFASSTSDWFHEKLPAQEIATLFAVAVAAVHLRGHTFQILTKRSDRMCEIMNTEAFWDQVNAEAGMHVMGAVDPLDRRRDDARATLDEYGPDAPPPGIWLGVSVEDQKRADERIPDLLRTPAAVRFLSCEPLLGPLDLTAIRTSVPSEFGVARTINALSGAEGHIGPFGPTLTGRIGQRIHWVIAGGESGPNARPMHPDWARELRDQCVSADVPFFFKQWGNWAPPPLDEDRAENLRFRTGDRTHVFEDHQQMGSVGKKAAGHLLDGVEWHQFPATHASDPAP